MDFNSSFPSLSLSNRHHECGQSKTTEITFFKVLLPVFEKATSILMYRDPTFSKDSNGLPDGKIVRQITYGHTFLSHVHMGIGKQVNQEIFHNKVLLVEDLPSTEEVNSVISYHRDQINGLLDDMEAVTANVFGSIDVTAKVVNGKRVNVEVSLPFFVLRPT